MRLLPLALCLISLPAYALPITAGQPCKNIGATAMDDQRANILACLQDVSNPAQWTWYRGGTNSNPACKVNQASSFNGVGFVCVDIPPAGWPDCNGPGQVIQSLLLVYKNVHNLHNDSFKINVISGGNILYLLSKQLKSLKLSTGPIFH
jgi:hypothetical protein